MASSLAGLRNGAGWERGIVGLMAWLTSGAPLDCTGSFCYLEFVLWLGQ